MAQGSADHAICHEHAVGARADKDVPLRILPLAQRWKEIVDVSLGWRIEVPCEINADVGTTVDAVWYDELTDVLHVADLKTGEMPVEAFQNDQLLFGAAAYCFAHGIVPRGFQLYIVQYDEDVGSTVRQWSVTLEQFYAFTASMNAAAKANLAATRDMVTKGPHCGRCRGRSNCHAHLSALSQTVAIALPGVSIRELPAPDRVVGALTMDQMGQLLDMQQWVTHLFAAVEKRALACGGVPGWTVGKTKPRARWKLSVPETLAALAELGIDGTDVITPAEARKELVCAVGKACADAAITRLSEKPTGTATLVAVDRR
jgi:hypothetical protein